MSSFDLEPFKESLMELTFNSRPIIQNLTTIAHEEMENYKEIVQTIEERVFLAKPREKLFILYLLDSICKNIGKEYCSEFEKNIYNVFVHAFESIKEDEFLKEQYLKLLKTWYVVFSHETLRKIEDKIKTIKNSNDFQKKVHVNTQVFQPKSNQELILEIQNTLQEKGGELIKKPHIQAQILKLNQVLNAPKVEIPSSPTSLLKSLSQHGLVNSTENLIKELYHNFEYQCNTCGRRFKIKNDYNSHYDSHFKKNQNLLLSRNWYSNHFDSLPWSSISNDTKKEENEEKEENVVSDENQDTCPICREKFEKIYNQKLDEWMYKNTILNKNNQIIHKGCSEEPLLKKVKFE